MIELFVIKETEWLELVAESVSLEGHRYQAPRSIEATIVTKQGSQTYYSVSEGDTVLFKWKGKELFRGIVFARTPDEHTLAFSAYDMLQYLVKNQDVYVFSNQRADQMIKRIANDFQIPVTTIANTGHTIKSLVFKNDTSLYDIMLKALKQTKKPRPAAIISFIRKKESLDCGNGLTRLKSGCWKLALILRDTNTAHRLTIQRHEW